jgi:hypothetical protein
MARAVLAAAWETATATNTLLTRSYSTIKGSSRNLHRYKNTKSKCLCTYSVCIGHVEGCDERRDGLAEDDWRRVISSEAHPEESLLPRKLRKTGARVGGVGELHYAIPSAHDLQRAIHLVVGVSLPCQRHRPVEGCLHLRGLGGELCLGGGRHNVIHRPQGIESLGGDEIVKDESSLKGLEKQSETSKQDPWRCFLK